MKASSMLIKGLMNNTISLAITTEVVLGKQKLRGGAHCMRVRVFCINRQTLFCHSTGIEMLAQNLR